MVVTPLLSSLSDMAEAELAEADQGGGMQSGEEEGDREEAGRESVWPPAFVYTLLSSRSSSPVPPT